MTASIRIDKNIQVPMRDGVVLRADVWRPDDDAAYPAIVHRTPYQKERATANDFLRFDLAASSGYAVVVQDTRGRFASDGVWEGLMWAHESRDSYDTVEWASAQPWCDGSVALWGVSYPAMCALLGAQAHPPHLKAIAAAEASDKALDVIEAGGALFLELLLGWFVSTIALEVPRRIADGTVSADAMATLGEAVRNPASVTDHLPLVESPVLDIPGSPISVRELFGGDVETSPSIRFEEIDVPVLISGGWFDIGSNASIEIFRRVREGTKEDVRERHRLVMGPWVHALMAPPYQGSVNFGIDAMGWMHLPAAHLAFFDQHLKGIETAELPPVRYFLMGANEWRDAPDWPPASTSVEAWYFHSDGRANGARGDGRLKRDLSDGQPPDCYRYNPADPVRTHGGRVLWLGGSVAGPLEQNHLEGREDVLCYTSDVMIEPIDVVGPVTVRLYAASTARDTDFVAKLVDVYPDGRAILVTDGCRRARFRKGYEKEVLLEPGVVEEYEINLSHTAWRVMPGHRLRVHVTSSNFPHLDRNMNTGNAVGIDAEGIVAEQRIFHDSARPSRLEISVARPNP